MYIRHINIISTYVWILLDLTIHILHGYVQNKKCIPRFDGHPEDATADERRGIVVTGQGKGADQQSCGGLTNIAEV